MTDTYQEEVPQNLDKHADMNTCMTKICRLSHENT